MDDDRQELVSVTMTREQWDGLRGASYADWPARNRAQEIVAEATGEGLEQRREAARREAAARLPTLTDETKRQVRREIARLIREHDAGRLKVDHLGCPQTSIGGFAVSLIPHIVGGERAIHFGFGREVWFERRALDLEQDDREWLIETVRAVAGVEDAKAWNDRGPWVSVALRPRRV